MEVRDNIIKGNFVFEPEDIWEHVSELAKKYIKRLLVTDPHLRPTARETQKDPWLIEMADLSKKTDEDHALNPSVVKALVNFKEYSDMRKLLCEVLSFTLIPDQIQGLRKEFEKMDTDGSGEISLHALKTVLLGNAAQGSLGGLAEEEVEDIFNAMRVSKSETTIHWHEFIAAGLSHCAVDERNLKLAFERLDADHTGYITFENFMDLIGNGAVHSEEALREMWGEASMNSTDAHITYEDFLLLMKGQTKSSSLRDSFRRPTTPNKMARPTTPMLDKLSLHPVVESSGSERPSSAGHASAGGFMSLSFEETLQDSDGPLGMDSDSDGALNQGFIEAVEHQGSGFLVKDSLIRTYSDSSPVDKKTRAKSFDSDEAMPPTASWQKNPLKPVNFPEHKHTDGNVNNLLSDKSKTPLVINRELYRAHRGMRLAVLEASKRLEEVQQRRASDVLQKEQARTNKGAGLIMRHGGELSADAIRQFVIQQQKEVELNVLNASKRSGRRHARNRTSSDIRGMFGNSGSDVSNLTMPKREATTGGVASGIPDFRNPPRAPATPTTPTKTPLSPDLPELPKFRDATKPGQFRKTTYDPFSFGVKNLSKKSDKVVVPSGELMRDTSLHRHIDNISPGLKKMHSDDHRKTLAHSSFEPRMKNSGSDLDNDNNRATVM